MDVGMCLLSAYEYMYVLDQQWLGRYYYQSSNSRVTTSDRVDALFQFPG